MAKREISREEFIKAVRFGSMVDIHAPYKHSGYIVGWIKDKDGTSTQYYAILFVPEGLILSNSVTRYVLRQAKHLRIEHDHTPSDLFMQQLGFDWEDVKHEFSCAANE